MKQPNHDMNIELFRESVSEKKGVKVHARRG